MNARTQPPQRQQQQQREVRHPNFVVRAPDPNNRGRWITLGYAWARKHGEEGLTVKLNALPIGDWQGSLILLPPLPNEEMPDRPDEQ
jgi:hypothetical protein